MRQSHIITVSLAVAFAGPSWATPTEVLVQSDYMTSGFFFSSNQDMVRGDETDSTRSALRATSTSIFGLIGETSYFAFDFNPNDFSTPVAEAKFRIQVVNTTGGLPTPDAANPSVVSIHSLTADPLASIDDTDVNDPGSWLAFRDSQITTSSIISTTTVDGPGIFEWDITALVNDWIANGDTNFQYTIGTSLLLDANVDSNSGGDTVAFVNSSWNGLTDEITGRIIIPAPGTALALVVGAASAARRRRK